MNQLAVSPRTEFAEHIKDSAQLAIDAINAHQPHCSTCRDLANQAARIKCPEGNNLWAALDQALALDIANQN